MFQCGIERQIDSQEYLVPDSSKSGTSLEVASPKLLSDAEKHESARETLEMGRAYKLLVCGGSQNELGVEVCSWRADTRSSTSRLRETKNTGNASVNNVSNNPNASRTNKCPQRHHQLLRGHAGSQSAQEAASQM